MSRVWNSNGFSIMVKVNLENWYLTENVVYIKNVIECVVEEKK